MNSIVHHYSGPKSSSFGHRFISSLSIVEKTPIFDGRRQQISIILDPVDFFTDYIKPAKLTVRDAKILHAYSLKSDVFHSNIFVANSLIDCYCKSDSLGYALNLFEGIPNPNLVSWNLVISGYNQSFLFEKSWETFCRMRLSGFYPNQFTYGSVISAIGALHSSLYGEQVYALAVKDGLFSNGYVRASMIDLFARYCCLGDALKIFYDVPSGNVVCWNALISGAVKNEEYLLALNLFHKMCYRLLLPNSFTFSSILTACAAVEDLQLGKQVHGQVIKCGAEDVFVGTAILDLYGKCQAVDEAVKEFLWMPTRNVVSWSAIISGFVQKGDSSSALQFFIEMGNTDLEINHYTMTTVLSACAHPNFLKEAIQIHCWILKHGFYIDPVVKSSLINTYAKIGLYDLSETVFRESEDFKNLGIWANMISAFGQENSTKAISLFQSLLLEGLKPDKFCCSSVLSVLDCLDLGRQMHCYVLKENLVNDISVSSSLFTMYSKCGSLEKSYEVFKKIKDKDNVAWAAMISGSVEHNCADQAIQLFREMLFEETVPDETTLSAALTACATLCSLKTGKEIHGHAFRSAVRWAAIGGSLVNMYAKCKELNMARKVFDMVPLKDQILCSALVSGYAQVGYIEESLQLFREILAADVEADSFTITPLLSVASTLNRFGIGTQLHGRITKLGIESEVSVGSSLLMMYSKCGSIDDCRKSFEQIVRPDLVSWTAMIASYAQHGKGMEALQAYDLMRKSGIMPDSVTFVGVLFACSHNGLVEEGYCYLNSMVKDYGIEPSSRHYACMVDLLGRSGKLKEAEKFINGMPIKPDALVWGTFLAACKIHGDVELGRLASEKVMELEPCDAGAYVSLSNICANVGQWEEVLKIRKVMKGNKMHKDVGWSSV